MTIMNKQEHLEELKKGAAELISSIQDEVEYTLKIRGRILKATYMRLSHLKYLVDCDRSYVESMFIAFLNDISSKCILSENDRLHH